MEEVVVLAVLGESAFVAALEEFLLAGGHGGGIGVIEADHDDLVVLADVESDVVDDFVHVIEHDLAELWAVVVDEHEESRAFGVEAVTDVDLLTLCVIELDVCGDGVATLVGDFEAVDLSGELVAEHLRTGTACDGEHRSK